MTDFSHEARIIQITICEEAAIIRGILTAPHILYKPSLAPDGSMWSALLGPNLMEGVCGFGETPEMAMADFDRAWHEEPTPTAKMLAGKSAAEDAKETQDSNSQFGVGA